MNALNKPSSHENGLASSSEYDMSEGRTTQRAIALLPPAYPLELTQEYQAAFESDDPALVLPSSHRLAIWQKYIGGPAHAKELAEVDEANRQALAEYEAAVAEVVNENQRITMVNGLAEIEYEQQLAKYRQELSQYHETYHDEEFQAKRAISLRCAELKAAIKSQEDFVAAAIEDAWRLTKARWKRKSIFKRLLSVGGYRRLLADTLNNYVNIYEQYDLGRRVLCGHYDFFLSCVGRIEVGRNAVYTPTETGKVLRGFLDQGKKWDSSEHRSLPEAKPFGTYTASDFIGIALTRKVFFQRVTVANVQQHRLKVLMERLKEQTRDKCDRQMLVEQYKAKILKRIPKPPCSPEKPILRQLMPEPPPPMLRTPNILQPPPECFDTPDKGLVEHVFKGSQVYGLEQVTTLARSRLFANDQVRPHFTLGGVPFPIVGNSPHMLIVGTTGSGKTTTLLRLMSSLLPLSTAQARRLAERLASGTTAYPESLHQWGRSRTHQAVVYNAKGEYLQYLEAFGFDSEVDLLNLDPADPNGYAWDVAADIDSRESIKKFAEQLIPKSVAASQDKQAEFWNGTARKIVEAIIVSLRNAARRAGRKPSWTLRDLVKIASNDSYIKEVLLWHDTPLEAVNKFFGHAAQQLSSVMLTLRECMGEYELLAQQWHHAKNRGRAVSLKKWSLEGGQSVLVLPDTMKNVTSYAPLNKAVMKALADIWLTDRYSLYFDENGQQRKRHRFLIVDEFGEAAQFDELQRIMGQGRTFGIHVVLGLHQLSQVRKAYGEEDSETIIGLCPYKAFLKNGDVRTQEWMSKLLGNCLQSYDKQTFSYSTSNGVTLTETNTEGRGGSEGTSDSESNSNTTGTSDTTGTSTSHTDSKNKSSTSSPKFGERGTSTSGTGESDSVTTNQSHTDNESTTKAMTTGTNKQTNWNNSVSHATAVNTSETKGGSRTAELRGEPAIEPSEFGRFADPETEGECEGVYITPTLPLFRTKLRMAQVQPEFEYPDKVRRASLVRSEEQDEEVTRPTEWTNQDLERLFLDKPHMLPEIPHGQNLLDNSEVVTQRTSVRNEQLFVEEQHDDEPPTPNFDFD